jgi:hypothetical protein
MQTRRAQRDAFFDQIEHFCTYAATQSVGFWLVSGRKLLPKRFLVGFPNEFLKFELRLMVPTP